MKRALALALVALAGCTPDVVIDEPALAIRKPKTIAVLPFTYTGDDPGERKDLMVAAVREAFHRHFSVVPYLHLESEATDRILRVTGTARATATQIGEALGTDAFIVGEVSAMSNLQAGLAFRRAIEGRIRLIDSTTGRELVRIDHTESDVGGLAFETGQLVEGVHRTIDNSSDLGFIRLAERFAASVVKALPAPRERPAVVPPAIHDVALVTSGSLRVGDVVEVAVKSEPERFASLDLGRQVADVPLFEEAPGLYRGFYRVVHGDRISGPVTVHVSDRFGVASSKILRERPLSMVPR